MCIIVNVIMNESKTRFEMVKEFQVIFPRFRITRNPTDEKSVKIELGVDRMTESHFQYPQLCTCEIYQGCDFFCQCGAEEATKKKYAESFKPVDIEKTQFQLVSIDANEFTASYHINFPCFDDPELAFDLPLEGSCLGCKPNHVSQSQSK